MNRTNFTFLVLVLTAVLTEPAAGAKPAKSWPWRQWIEPEFPFFSTVVDARACAFRDNLTLRGLVFPLGADCYLA